MANYTSTRADGAAFDASLDLADSALQSGTSADNIDDSASTNKFTTDAEKLIFKAESVSSFLSKHDGKFKGSGVIKKGTGTDINGGFTVTETVSNELQLDAGSVYMNKAIINHPTINLLYPDAPNSVSQLYVTDVKILRSAVIHHNITSTNKAYPLGFKNYTTTTTADGINTNLTQENPVFDDGVFLSDDNRLFNLWDWSLLSIANKEVIFSNEDNNIYRDNNSELRQVTYEEYTHRIDNTTFVGDLSDPYDVLTSIGATWDATDKKWTYTDNTIDYEITGFCISQRRNQGAREPSYNPAGSAKFGDSNFWYNTTDARSNVTDCFTTVGNGSIAGANSGRENDGYFYDSIQASDIRDIRYLASGDQDSRTGTEELRRRAISGEARGWEATAFTYSDNHTATSSDATSSLLQTDDTSFISVGDYVSIVDASTVVIDRAKITGITTNVDISWDSQFGTYNRVSATNYEFIIESSRPYYQSNDGSTTDLIGVPVRITATFPDGVAGRWIPVIPDGTSKDFKYTKKLLNQAGRLFTGNDGATWSSASFTPDTTNNDITIAFSAADVGIYNYTYNPNFTQPANNAEVLDGYISDVFASNNHEVVNGSTMCQSTIDKVSTANTSVKSKELIIQELTYFNDTKTLSTPVKHSVINLDADSSPALKCFFHAFDDNGVLAPHIKFKEMVYDVTWGDNNEFEITDGVATLTDSNGNTVLHGTHALNDDWNILL